MEKFNKIKILDDNLINKIAAGEVIERPSSIVKELVENAIDANAKNISIEIKNGGKSYIKIQDDGTGIKKDEINTAFIRHSTSKITDIDDLDNILTLGFRGEALASIASIARVEMTTKTEHDDIGTQISIEGGVFKSKKEIATLVGSTFVIKDIFFNIPARLKFLKKDASESFYITEIITKLALGNPNVSFKYLNNNTEIISTDGSGILKNTALYVYGGEIAKALLPIEATKNNFKLTGLVGRPEISRGNRNYSNFFINNRYIKSKLVNDAIGEAYSGKLMNSKFPVVILNLTTPEGSVDVNVHPTKLEARFENENFIYEFLIDSIEEELSKHILIPSIAVSKDKSIIKNNVEFNTNNNIIDLTQASELDINNSSADLSTPQALELDIKSTTDLS
ncbi:MAG: DNA mismatch repair endonuclease MutL, partial [bacterium]